MPTISYGKPTPARLNLASPLATGFIGGHYFPAGLHPFNVAYPYSKFETATLIGGATRVADGVKADGDNQQVRFADLTGLQQDQSVFTLACRWRATIVPSAFYYWLSGEDFNNTSWRLATSSRATNVSLYRQDNGFTMPLGFDDGSWVTFIASCTRNTSNGTHAYVWKDGLEIVADTSSGIGNTADTGGFYLGRNSVDRHPGGVTQFVYSWNRILSDAERQFLARSPDRLLQRPLRPSYFFNVPAAAGINQTVIPGTLPIVGQTVPLTLTIDQTVSPGTLPIVGQTVTLGISIDQTVSPGTLPIVGQSVGFDLGAAISQTVIPGTLPIVGQTVPLTLTIEQTVSPGTLPIVGQTVTLGISIDQTVSAGTLPIVGQTLTQDISAAINQTVSPGTLPIIGQIVHLTLTVDQTVSPGTLPIVGQSVGFAITGALDQTVVPGTLPITGQTLTLILKTQQGTLLDDIEEDLGATFFECSGLGFATDFVHNGITYCGIFTAEATDISERRNAFIETETSNTTVMSRGDVIEVIATPLNAGGTFTIRGLSPDGTGQSEIILDNV